MDLVLSTADGGGEAVVTLEKDTRIMLDGAAAAPGDLKPGCMMRISVAEGLREASRRAATAARR